jgi:hypothetical protein
MVARLAVLVSLVPCLAAAAPGPTRLLSTSGPGRATVVAGGAALHIEPPAGAHQFVCGEPQATVEENGHARPALLAPPHKLPFIFRGKRAAVSLCDDDPCRPAPTLDVALREYKETAKQDGIPVYSLVPLSGRIAVSLHYYGDTACTQPQTFTAQVEHRPDPSETPVDDEVVVVRLRTGGLEDATVLARYPDADTGPLLLVAGRRGSASELDLAQIDAATKPLTLARTDSRAANLNPFIDAPDLLDVWIRETQGRDSRTVHHIVRLGPAPAEVCALKQADVTVKDGVVSYQGLSFERRPGPDLTFDVAYQESRAGETATTRHELWRLDAHGCGPAR